MNLKKNGFTLTISTHASSRGLSAGSRAAVTCVSASWIPWTSRGTMLAGMVGFTLIEMLLVMVIAAAILLGIATYTQQRTDQLRMDRAVLQIQQILNAGMSYYISNTKWPASLEKDLQGDGTSANPGGYLPGPAATNPINNPWGNSYSIGATSSTTGLFAVCTQVTSTYSGGSVSGVGPVNGPSAPAMAQILAGRLPMAYVVDGAQATCPPDSKATQPCASTTCTVVSTVNVPGQNLNNARSVNFAGTYSNGGCVATPACPQGMNPTIVVAPISVSGMNESTNSVYPISSFTAFVSGDYSTSPGPCFPTTDTVVPRCPGGNGADGKPQNYWRVCLQIITEKSAVTYNSTTGGYAQVMAITRCAPNGEDSQGTVAGSPISVFSY